MTQRYTVKTFAEMAGVSVRTLHYYDECGLLKPSAYNKQKHRLYEMGDLLRLQQILTLKHMGFSLDEIDALLNSPGYEVRRSLKIQKQAIDVQIEQLRQVSAALEKAITEVEAIPAATLDWMNVGAIIRGIVADNKASWLRRYYDDVTWARVKARGRQFSEAQLAEGTQAWADLIAAFIKLRHRSADHPSVQALAAQMHDLIHQFTGGDPQIRAGMRGMYADMDAIPQNYRIPGHDQELQDFMMQAYTIYEEANP